MFMIVFLLLAIGAIAAVSMLVVGIVMLCRHMNRIAGILLTVFGGIFVFVMIIVVLSVVIGVIAAS